LIHNNQRGFTLIEVVLAIALTGIITGGITMSIFQVFDGNTRTSNHMIAVRQVQNAGYWISHDAQMAQSVELEWQGETPVGTKFPLNLTWTEWDGTSHQVVYTLIMPGSPKQLERQHLTYDTDGNEIGNETTIVAQYINPGLGNTSLDSTDSNGDGIIDKLILKITAKVGTGSQEASETRVYEITPRPNV